MFAWEPRVFGLDCNQGYIRKSEVSYFVFQNFFNILDLLKKLDYNLDFSLLMKDKEIVNETESP